MMDGFRYQDLMRWKKGSYFSSSTQTPIRGWVRKFRAIRKYFSMQTVISCLMQQVPFRTFIDPEELSVTAADKPDLALSTGDPGQLCRIQAGKN